MAIRSRRIEISQNEDLNGGAGITWGFATAADGNVQNRLPANIVAVNFSGCTAKLAIRQGQGANAPLLLLLTSTLSQITFGTYTDPTGATWGTITVLVTNAQSAALPPGEWYFDLEVITAVGIQTYYVQGPCAVAATGTR